MTQYRFKIKDIEIKILEIEKGYPPTTEDPGMPDSITDYEMYFENKKLPDWVCEIVFKEIENEIWEKIGDMHYA